MVLLVMLLVLLSIKLRQQPNLTTIQHNLKTDTPKKVKINKKILLHTDLFFCSMLHAQYFVLCTYTIYTKGVYSIFEYKTNFERDAFRFSMIFVNLNVLIILL
jgi:hypothetical protein